MEQSNIVCNKLQKKREKKDKIYAYKDFENLNSGKSSILEHTQNLQPYKQFSKLIGQKSIKGVVGFLKQMRGRNEPTTCSKDYNFKQRWEIQPNRSDEEKLIYKEISNLTIILSTVMMIIKVVLIWIFSIFRIFGCANNNWIFICGITFQLIDIGMNLPLILILDKKQIGKQSKIELVFHKQNLKVFLTNIYSLCYHFLGIININTIENINHLFLLPLDYLVVCLLYVRTKKIYHQLRILAVRSRHKHLMNLFDLMSNLFIMAHLFAILLFCCTFAFPNENFLINTNFHHDDWINYYVYSFYFVCTTMLTVGYGDLTPKNTLQIVAILIVQFFGIINFGYVINEFGVHLSKMRQVKQSIEKDIINTQKLAKYNKMTADLRQRVRTFVIHNQLVNQQLDVVQQENLLNKLSEQLKTEVLLQNQLRIIKTSLFLLVNFSKRMQLEISKKLIKTIYSPNTTLIQTFGKQKLFILTRGTINITTQKNKNKFVLQKLLKTIVKQFNEQQFDISNNVYGYSAFFSGKPSSIKGLSKTFSICFTIDRQNLQDCIAGIPEDFQSYHRLKAKYQLVQNPERYETPNIMNVRQHYLPNIFYLIKKQYIDSVPHQRKFIVRNGRKIKLMMEKYDNQSQNNLDIQQMSVTTEENESIIQENKKINKRQRNITYQKIMNNANKLLNLGKSKMFARKYINNKKYQEIKKRKLEQKYNILIKEQVYIELCRQYKNYYPKHNVSQVLKRHNQKNIQILRSQAILDEKHQSSKLNFTRLQEIRNQRIKKPIYSQ